MRLATPYSRLAGAYDGALGVASFLRTRDVFERLARLYRIRFRSAADLGCGTGLFALYLARCHGVPVFAVDVSPAMLQVASRNCACAPGLRLLRQDVRCLRLPHSVDVATANFDTLNHFSRASDLAAALRSVAANLNPGGHFVFDVLTTCQSLARACERRVRTASRRVTQHIRWEPDRKRLAIRVVIRAPNSPHAAVEEHHERLYTPAEIDRALAHAGFIVRGTFDAETLRPASHCPSRLIVVAQKR